MFINGIIAILLLYVKYHSIYSLFSLNKQKSIDVLRGVWYIVSVRKSEHVRQIFKSRISEGGI